MNMLLHHSLSPHLRFSSTQVVARIAYYANDTVFGMNYMYMLRFYIVYTCAVLLHRDVHVNVNIYVYVRVNPEHLVHVYKLGYYTCISCKRYMYMYTCTYMYIVNLYHIAHVRICNVH